MVDVGFLCTVRGAVVIAKGNFSPADKPGVSYPSVTLAALGATLKVSCDLNQFQAITEGSPYDCQLLLKDSGKAGGGIKATLKQFSTPKA